MRYIVSFVLGCLFTLVSIFVIHELRLNDSFAGSHAQFAAHSDMMLTRANDNSEALKRDIEADFCVHYQRTKILLDRGFRWPSNVFDVLKARYEFKEATRLMELLDKNDAEKSRVGATCQTYVRNK